MFRQLPEYMYGFTLAISCYVKHQTFQANSSSILMSPCLKLLLVGLKVISTGKTVFEVYAKSPIFPKNDANSMSLF